MVTLLFLGGVQLITLVITTLVITPGVIGEHLGRMFDESKRRPLYFVKGYAPAAKTPPPR